MSKKMVDFCYKGGYSMCGCTLIKASNTHYTIMIIHGIMFTVTGF